jgi:hypothetical protein
MSKLGTAANAVSRPTRVSISYAALVALITEAVLFVQDVFVHRTWTERDTLFIIAAAVGVITLVGPFLPVPVSFDSNDSPPSTDTVATVDAAPAVATVPPASTPAQVTPPVVTKDGNPWLPTAHG